MPRFEVTVTVNLELTGRVTVTAKDDDAASEKVEKMIADGDFTIGQWSPVKAKDAITWDEIDQTAEIETVEEE